MTDPLALDALAALGVVAALIEGRTGILTGRFGIEVGPSEEILGVISWWCGVSIGLWMFIDSSWFFAVGIVLLAIGFVGPLISDARFGFFFATRSLWSLCSILISIFLWYRHFTG